MWTAAFELNGNLKRCFLFVVFTVRKKKHMHIKRSKHMHIKRSHHSIHILRSCVHAKMSPLFMTILTKTSLTSRL